MTIDIAAIRARAEEIGKRAEKATEGAWGESPHSGYGDLDLTTASNGGWFLSISSGLSNRDPAELHEQFRDNVDFIKGSRSDIPALITDISALVEEVERLTKQNSAITNAADHLLMVRNTRAEAAEQRAATAEALLRELVAAIDKHSTDRNTFYPELVFGELHSGWLADARAHLSANAEQIVQVPVVGDINREEPQP